MAIQGFDLESLNKFVIPGQFQRYDFFGVYFERDLMLIADLELVYFKLLQREGFYRAERIGATNFAFDVFPGWIE